MSAGAEVGLDPSLINFDVGSALCRPFFCAFSSTGATYGQAQSEIAVVFQRLEGARYHTGLWYSVRGKVHGRAVSGVFRERDARFTLAQGADKGVPAL